MKLIFDIPDKFKNYKKEIIDYVMEAIEIMAVEDKEEEAIEGIEKEVEEDMDKTKIGKKTWKEIKKERRERRLGGRVG